MWEVGAEEKEEQQAEKRARVSLYPSPRYRTEKEMNVLGGCVARWIKELTKDMDGAGRGMQTLGRRVIVCVLTLKT